jgi:hypothetical protein
MRLALLPLVLLAGCGTPSTQNTAAPAVPTEPTAFQNQVAALSEGQRDAMLLRAIRDARMDCQGVTGSSPSAASTPTKPVWIARCSNGAGYGVVINADGTAGVVGAAQ